MVHFTVLWMLVMPKFWNNDAQCAEIHGEWTDRDRSFALYAPKIRENIRNSLIPLLYRRCILSFVSQIILGCSSGVFNYVNFVDEDHDSYR